MGIGERIKTIRENKGLKQIELAEMAGISNSYLSDIEKGRTTPSIRTLTRLAEALGVEVGYIFLKSNYVITESIAAYDVKTENTA